jgi:hypothetical protein
MEATQDEEQSASGAINRTQIVQLTAQCGSKWFIMALHEDSGLEWHDRSTVKYKKVIHPLFYMTRIQQSLQCLQSLNALRVLTCHLSDFIAHHRLCGCVLPVIISLFTLTLVHIFSAFYQLCWRILLVVNNMFALTLVYVFLLDFIRGMLAF